MESRSDLEDLPLIQSFATEESDSNSELWVSGILGHKLMEPLFHENPDGRSDEADSEAA